MLTFLVKNGKMKLIGEESIFQKYAKKLKVKSRNRSRPQSLNLKVSNCYLRYPHCTVEP